MRGAFGAYLFAVLLDAAASLRLATARPRSTPARATAAEPRQKWVLGLNQYSHDAGAALLSTDGTCSVIVPKERVTRAKCDGGDTAAAVEHALGAVGATLDDVVCVCRNNHHFRVAPFEKRLDWSVRLGIYPESTVAEANLLPGVPKHELSHHLAHAWSVLAQAPFERGLVVVMDGMGETYDAMAAAQGEADEGYTHELDMPPDPSGFTQVPPDAGPGMGLREAESVYSFDGLTLRRVFKRWVPHRSPPELYNHGFENLESLGALYSRVSSHIFGDWNACGKVMGLAPWERTWAGGGAAGGGGALPPLARGRMVDGDWAPDWGAIEALPHANSFKRVQSAMAASDEDDGGGLAVGDLGVSLEEERAFHVSLASSVQRELEEQVISV